MKITLLVAILLLSALSASAQRATLYTLGPYDGGTNNITGASTNTVTTAAISVEEFASAGVTVSIKPISTSTGTVVFKFSEAMGSTYETTPSHSLTVTLAGTATITQNADFTTPNCGSLALVEIVSTNAMAMTNIVVQVRLKAPKQRIETR